MIELQDLSVFSIILQFVISLAVVIVRLPRSCIIKWQRPYTGFLHNYFFVVILAYDFSYVLERQGRVYRIDLLLLHFHMFRTYWFRVNFIYAFQVYRFSSTCSIKVWLFHNHLLRLTNSTSFRFRICQTLKIDDLLTRRGNRLLRASNSILLYSLAIWNFSMFFLSVFVAAIDTYFLMEELGLLCQRIYDLLHVFVGVVPALENFPVIELDSLVAVSTHDAYVLLPVRVKVGCNYWPWFTLHVYMSRIESFHASFFI